MTTMYLGHNGFQVYGTVVWLTQKDSIGVDTMFKVHTDNFIILRITEFGTMVYTIQRFND